MGESLSSCHLNKQRLINSLGVEVHESAGLINGAQASLPYKISRFLRGSPDRLGYAVETNRLGKKARGRPLVPLCCEEHSDSLVTLIHGMIPVVPPPFDFDIRPIYLPADPDRTLAAVVRHCEWGPIFEHPAVGGRMIDGDATLAPEYFHLAIAPGIRDRPPHTSREIIPYMACP